MIILDPRGMMGLLYSLFIDFTSLYMANCQLPTLFTCPYSSLRPEPGIFDLKQDTGGIVDIEFLVQYLVLLKSNEFSDLLRWTDNVRVLETLIETEVLEKDAADILKEAYLTYRAAVHRLNLQEKPATVPDEQFGGLRKNILEIWKAFMESD